MNNIHPTAFVSADAKLGRGVSVGAYSIIDSGAVIGEKTQIREHVIIRPGTTIGSECTIHPFAVLGEEPQHLAYKGEPTTVEIGDRVILRESTTVHRGTAFGNKATRIGDDCFIMAYTHVAHDCQIGKKVIIANAVQLAGHVEIDSFVTLGGHSAVAQFCRVGRYCYIGGGTVIRKDVPPFLLGKGAEFEVQGINAIGLEKSGFSESTVKRLRNLYKIFFLQKLTVSKAIEKIMLEVGDTDDVRLFLDFVKSSKNGIHR